MIVGLFLSRFLTSTLVHVWPATETTSDGNGDGEGDGKVNDKAKSKGPKKSDPQGDGNATNGHHVSGALKWPIWKVRYESSLRY